MKLFFKIFLIGLSSALLFLKQYVISLNLGPELFGLYATLFMFVAVFQQLGGLGGNARYTSLITMAEDKEWKHFELWKLKAIVPLLLTSPALTAYVYYETASIITTILVSIIALLNYFFIIANTEFYVNDTKKYINLQVYRATLSLTPCVLSFFVSDITLLLLIDLLAMIYVNIPYFKKFNLADYYDLSIVAEFKILIIEYFPAIFLAVVYTYVLRVYVSASFDHATVGLFFFSQLIIMIAQNLQYVCSIFSAPLVKKYKKFIIHRPVSIPFSYLCILLCNAILFFVIYHAFYKIVEINSSYSEALPLLLPTVFVSVLRASDLISTFVMLIGKPIFAALQQFVAILLFLGSVYLFVEGQLSKTDGITMLLKFEFISLFVSQVLTLMILTYYLTKKKLD